MPGCRPDQKLTIRSLAILPLAVTLMLLIASCGQPEGTAGSSAGNPPAAEESESDGKTGQVFPAEAFTCPIDGEAAGSLPPRALAVTVDNFRLARPQTGLDQADLIYEVPVEGGITRYVAIYYSGEAPVVGPIRSARPYLVDLAREWGAIYVHAGQSPQAQVYFKKTGAAHINQMNHESGFWRDRSRKAPHNLYSGTEALRKEAASLGLDDETPVDGYLFRGAFQPASGAPAATIRIEYQYATVGYRYDAASGKYLRELNGSPYCDAASGAQLAAANVLVQRVPVRAFDGEGRLEVGLTGHGEAFVFNGGAVVSASWEKDAVTERTRFYDDTGAEIPMNRGQTWIQLVPPWVEVEYK